MLRSLVLLLLGSAVVAPLAAAQDLQGPHWTPVSFKVGKSDGGALADLEQGTQVTVRLEGLGQKIVMIDAAKSTVDSFTDDKKTDLLAAVPARPGFARRVIEVDFPGLSRKPNDVVFRSPDLPARGATKVLIKGTVVVLVGKDEKEVEKKDVELKTGFELEFGKFKPPANGFSTRPATFTSLTYDGTKPLASVTLLDGDGKEVACRFAPRYRSVGANDKPSASGSLSVTGNKAPARCTVRVKYFDSVEEIKVPLNLEVGPGL